MATVEFEKMCALQEISKTLKAILKLLEVQVK